MFRRIRRPSPGTVIASVALLIALGGTAYAAAELPANSVGKLQMKNDAVGSAEILDGSVKKVDLGTPLPRGLRGVRGPAGPIGPQGAQGGTGPAGVAGPAGPGARWVLVRPDGTIQAQSTASGITLVSHSSPGNYIFNAGGAVTGKLIIASNGLAGDATVRGATLAGPCGGPPEGFTCTVANDTSHLIVATQNATATATADHSFYLAIIG